VETIYKIVIAIGIAILAYKLGVVFSESGGIMNITDLIMCGKEGC